MSLQSVASQPKHDLTHLVHRAPAAQVTIIEPLRNTEPRIRILWLTNVLKFRLHLKRLDADARQAWFGHFVKDDFIDAYADTAWRLGTMMFGAFVEGERRGSGELRLLPRTLPLSAEGTIAVETAFQNQGLGQRLCRRSFEKHGRFRHRHAGWLLRAN